MKVLFLGTTGVHHTLVAANLFINGQRSDIVNIPNFADKDLDHTGHPIYVGRDPNGNDVYTLGAGRDVLMAKKTIEELVGVLGFYPHDLLVKPVKIKGDIFFPFLNKVSNVLGGKRLNRYLAQNVIESQIDNIAQQVDAFKQHYQLH